MHVSLYELFTYALIFHAIGLTFAVGTRINCDRIDISEETPLKLFDLRFTTASTISTNRGSVTLQQ